MQKIKGTWIINLSFYRLNFFRFLQLQIYIEIYELEVDDII